MSVAAGAWVGSKPMPAAPARASPATSASTSRAAHPGEADPGRQQELAAPDHARHERRLEDVHPLDPVPEPVPAGRHRDLGSEELLEAEEVADREDRVS